MKFILSLILFIPLLLYSQLNGKVVAISDGDTFTVLTNDKLQIKIRLAGIDCPEKSQPFSNVCKKYLSDLIFAKQVSVVNTGIDRYGRTLGIVFLGNINVNESILTQILQ